LGDGSWGLLLCISVCYHQNYFLSCDYLLNFFLIVSFCFILICFIIVHLTKGYQNSVPFAGEGEENQEIEDQVIMDDSWKLLC
jgi:hypothetical protein